MIIRCGSIGRQEHRLGCCVSALQLPRVAKHSFRVFRRHSRGCKEAAALRLFDELEVDLDRDRFLGLRIANLEIRIGKGVRLI